MRHGNEIAVNETAVNKIAVNEIEAGRSRAVFPGMGDCAVSVCCFCIFIVFHFILSLLVFT